MRSNRRVPWPVPTHPQTRLGDGVEEISTRHAGHRALPTFSDAVGFLMSDDCGLDERFENLGRSKLAVLYGFDDLQT